MYAAVQSVISHFADMICRLIHYAYQKIVAFPVFLSRDACISAACCRAVSVRLVFVTSVYCVETRNE